MKKYEPTRAESCKLTHHAAVYRGLTAFASNFFSNALCGAQLVGDV